MSVVKSSSDCLPLPPSVTTVTASRPAHSVDAEVGALSADFFDGRSAALRGSLDDMGLAGDQGPSMVLPTGKHRLTSLRQSHAGPWGRPERRYRMRGYDGEHPRDVPRADYEQHPHDARFQTTWSQIRDGARSLLRMERLPAPAPKQMDESKYDLDPDVILQITREGVDAFPELQLRMTDAQFNARTGPELELWSRHQDVLQRAQEALMVERFAQEYPEKILQDTPTYLMTVGGAKFYLRVIYCGLQGEYLAMCKAPWSFEGQDSGSYKGYVWDFFTNGRNRNWEGGVSQDGQRRFEIRGPGEWTVLETGEREVWSMRDCAMWDYGRIDLLDASVQGLINSFTVAPNPDAVKQTIGVQVKGIMKTLAARLGGGDVTVSADSARPMGAPSDEEVKAARAYFASLQAVADAYKSTVAQREDAEFWLTPQS